MNLKTSNQNKRVKGLTLEKDPINVPNVRKPSPVPLPFMTMEAFMLERNPMNVNSVTKPSVASVPFTSTNEFILEKNPTNGQAVVNSGPNPWTPCSKLPQLICLKFQLLSCCADPYRNKMCISQVATLRPQTDNRW
ncbi:uncharacterized protein [Chlorocebus sabaeus]|uniref:uncharacterized protein isoform X2 n=1 Tax=Chlorocebus sabaeus TaxID=60711 RepID=UPI003BFA0EED